MIWSKYNYLYRSNKHNEFFLYNSRTNSFLILSKDLFTDLKRLESFKSKDVDIKQLDENIKGSLIKAKVLTSKFEEDNFITQKKLIKYKQSFQEKKLGIVVVPTLACNFKCPYCYESNLPPDTMSDDTENNLIQFIKSFQSSDNLSLCWHGGEPLIAFNNIKRFLKKVQHEDSIKIKDHSMVTNGYLLTKQKCLFFKEHNLNMVQITIDGLRDNHNKSRIHKKGHPTYDVIIKNIENIFRIIPECHVVIRMNVHSQNQHDYPLLYEELTKKWGNQNYTIQMKYANNHDNGCRVECFKNNDKIFYAEKLYNKYNLKNLNFYPSFKIGGCAATHINSFVIGTKGEIYKCWVEVGKMEKSIGNIINKNLNTGLLAEYIVGTDMFSDNKCLECVLFPVCDGGCNIKRLEYKMFGKDYDVCPIDINNLDVLLDMFYQTQLDKKQLVNS